MSELAGYPSRSSFIDHILKTAPKRIASTAREINERDSDLLVDLLATEISRTELLASAQRLYEADVRRVPTSDALHDLAGVPFSSAITMSWDESLEVLFRGRRPVILNGSKSDDMRAAHDPSRFAIIQLFGGLDQESFRFGGDAYRATILRNSEFARAISSRTANTTVFFYGLTVSEFEGFFSGFPLSADEVTASYG